MQFEHPVTTELLQESKSDDRGRGRPRHKGPDSCSAGVPARDFGVLYPAGQSIVIQGPTSDPADGYISLAFNNRFLWLDNAKDITLRNLTVVLGDGGTGAGGAIHAIDTSLTLDNVDIGFNQCDQAGGGVYYETQYLNGLKLVIRDSNVSVNAVGGAQAKGGGLYAAVNGTTEVRIEGSVLSQNTISDPDSSVWGGGAFIDAADQASVVIADSAFNGNSAEAEHHCDGVGLYLHLKDTTTGVVRGLSILGNTGDVPVATNAYEVPGMNLQTSDSAQLVAERIELRDNVVVNGSDVYQTKVSAGNQSNLVVADMLTVGSQIGIYAASGLDAVLTLAHITATQNEIGIKIYGGEDATTGLYNSITSKNTTQNIDLLGGIIDLSDNYFGSSPGFVDEVNGDFHPRSYSPAVDAGDATNPGTRFSDLDHGPRVAGPDTDLGAYEYGGIFADDFESGDETGWS